MPATGPDFISLQARDLDASQAFYERYLGLVRSQAGPPHAVVFETRPIAFALRDVVPGTDLDSVTQPGIGAAIWLHATGVQDIHWAPAPGVGGPPGAAGGGGPPVVPGADRGPVGRAFPLRRPGRHQGDSPRP